MRATIGERAKWGDTEHLLADVVDLLHIQLWQKTKRGTPRPKPVPRPGVKAKGERRFGTGRMTIAQARKYLDRFKAKGDSSGS